MKRSGECGVCRDSPRNPECRGRKSLDASFDLDAHFIVKTAMDLQALMSFVFEVTEKWSRIGYQTLLKMQNGSYSQRCLSLQPWFLVAHELTAFQA